MTKLETLCYEIYEKGGQYAVYRYVRDTLPDAKWEECRDCEDSTPREPTNGSCLVCGQG